MSLLKNKLLLAVILLTFMISLTGCPYMSDVPLCCFKNPIDNSLIGNWKATTSDGAPPEYYSFSRRDDYNYTVVQEKYNSSDNKYTQSVYSGFITTLDDTRMLNFYSGDIKSYLFAKFRMGYNTLSLAFISDKWFTVIQDEVNYTFLFSTSEELTKHVKNLMGHRGFYEDTQQFYKY